MSNSSPYQKVCQDKSWLRFTGKQSLWNGKGHLLAVNRVGLFVPLKEDYSRIEYADIEGLTVHRMPRSLWVTVVFWILAVGFASGVAICQQMKIVQSTGLLVSLSLPAIFFLLIAIARTFKSQPVRCVLHTRAQDLALTCVDRDSHLKKLLDVLIPHIRAVQPEVDLASLLRQVDAEGFIQKARDFVSLRKEKYRGLWHYIGNGLLLFDGLLALVAFVTPVPTIFNLRWIPCAFSCLGYALAWTKERYGYVPNYIQRFTFMGLGCMFLCKYMMLFVGYMIIGIQHQFVPNTKTVPDPFKLIFEVGKMSPWDNPGLLAISSIDVSVSLFIGIGGLIASWSWFKKVNQQWRQ